MGSIDIKGVDTEGLEHLEAEPESSESLCVLLDLDFLEVLGLITVSSQIYGLSSEYKQIMGCEMSVLGLSYTCRGWCQVQQSLIWGSDWGL